MSGRRKSWILFPHIAKNGNMGKQFDKIAARGRIYYKAVDFKKPWADQKEAEVKSGKTRLADQFGPLRKKRFASEKADG
jgi:hypothetical protein